MMMMMMMISASQSLKPGLQICRKDRKHMVANSLIKLSTYALVFTQL